MRLYAPRLRQLGYRHRDGEAGAATALRTRLAEFLAMRVRDPAVRAELSRQGRAALGLDGSGTADLSRADPDLLRITLAVAVQDGGAAAFDAARTAFESDRGTAQRYALLAALGATHDPALGARARDYGLTPAVQIGEMASLYGAQMDEPENRAMMWQWLQRHFDAYRARLPAFAQSRLPALVADGRCDVAGADEADPDGRGRRVEAVAGLVAGVGAVADFRLAGHVVIEDVAAVGVQRLADAVRRIADDDWA